MESVLHETVMTDGPQHRALKLSCLGDTAILCESAGPLDLQLQARFWALSQVLAGWSAVDEVVPGMNNVMVVLRADISTPWDVLDAIRQEWAHVSPAAVRGRVVDIPVDYGGEHGPDLAFVAQRANLSVDDVVALHSQADYTVYFLGAHAGFGYLGGLDRRLHTPRLEQPRLQVPAGSVAIGGAQTGVIALTSPSGWRLIGKAEQAFFDPHRMPPALLAPGDTVRFRINRLEA